MDNCNININDITNSSHSVRSKNLFLKKLMKMDSNRAISDKSLRL